MLKKPGGAHDLSVAGLKLAEPGQMRGYRRVKALVNVVGMVRLECIFVIQLQIPLQAGLSQRMAWTQVAKRIGRKLSIELCQPAGQRLGAFIEVHEHESVKNFRLEFRQTHGLAQLRDRRRLIHGWSTDQAA